MPSMQELSCIYLNIYVATVPNSGFIVATRASEWGFGNNRTIQRIEMRIFLDQFCWLAMIVKSYQVSFRGD